MLLMQLIVLFAELTEGLVFFWRERERERRKYPEFRVTVMSHHNRSVSLFERILQENGVNTMLKYHSFLQYRRAQGETYLGA